MYVTHLPTAVAFSHSPTKGGPTHTGTHWGPFTHITLHLPAKGVPTHDLHPQLTNFTHN